MGTTPSVEKTKFIYGPLKSHYLLHPDKKQFIILFGEWHGEYKEKCGDKRSEEVSDFIDGLIKRYSTHFFDVLLEFNLKYKCDIDNYSKYYCRGASSDGFHNMVAKFKECADGIAECKNKNMRFHLADPRIFMRWYQILDEIKNFLDEADFSKEEEFLEELDILLDPVQKEDYWRDKKKVSELMKLIIKQITLIHPSYNRNLPQVMKLWEEVLDNESKLEKEIGHTIKEFRNFSFSHNKSKEKSIKYYKKIINKLTKYRTRFVNTMDIYVITKMMHEFKEKIKSHPNSVKNAIVYTGWVHTDNIRNFYLDLGYKEVFSGEIEGSEQCAEVEEDILKWLV